MVVMANLICPDDIIIHMDFKDIINDHKGAKRNKISSNVNALSILIIAVSDQLNPS